MGLYATDSSLYVSHKNLISRFEAIKDTSQLQDDFDRLYIPQVLYNLGGLDVHDLVVDQSGKLIFTNTLFNCLATTDEQYNFIPLWQPFFISDLAPIDRCHLNGLALRDGQARYVSLCAQTDQEAGWRDDRDHGGCLIDLQSNTLVAQGLSMPHSPRWYQDRLWLLNSGQGEFGYVNPDRKTFKPITFCPGYLRGLAFYQQFAIVGISEFREDKTFSPLPFRKKLADYGVTSHCGLLVIDLSTGTIVECLIFEAGIKELYDVVVFPEIKQPTAIALDSEEAQTTLSINRIF